MLSQSRPEFFLPYAQAVSLEHKFSKAFLGPLQPQIFR
jgi:hypothetical protein